MRSKTILIGLFIMSVALLGGILWRNGQVTAVATANQRSKAMILVAAQPLRTGTLLRVEDLQWATWTGEQFPAGVIRRPTQQELQAKPDADVQAMSGVSGAVLRQRIDAGQPILSNLIVKPGDRGFLAAVLAPGHRAISIGVSQMSGGAGLIFPGDHVDLILTQTFKQGDEPLARRSVGETIISDLRVLAIDQKLQQVTADPNESKAQIPRTVTLEVLPKQAEMIDVAAELGKLSLTLRSVPTNDGAAPTVAPSAAETAHSTWADDVSPALKPQKPAALPTSAPRIQIMRGSKIEDVKG